MNIMSPKWANRFMRKASTWAKECSKDPSSQVGCVIVSDDGAELSTGYNGLPRDVEDLPERIEVRPTKYLFMAHAEENAITNAARHGVRLQGSTMFVTHEPCARCAGMIINAGIKHLVVGGGETRMPKEEFEVSRVKLKEAGVYVNVLSVDDTV